jgi:hypothetical protein
MRASSLEQAPTLHLPHRKLRPEIDDPVFFSVPTRLPVKAPRSEGGGRAFTGHDRRQQRGSHPDLLLSCYGARFLPLLCVGRAAPAQRI